MPGYIDRKVSGFLATPDGDLIATLHRAYANDGFSSQYTQQTLAWETSLPLIKEGLQAAIRTRPEIVGWQVVVEYPLYRLRRRADLVLVSPQAVAVIELKVGEDRFNADDLRQAEEYALDLRDFHEFSHDVPLVPALWCTEADPTGAYELKLQVRGVGPLVQIGRNEFGAFLCEFAAHADSQPQCVHEDWGQGAYRPVPSVIEAATSLFAGHGVQEITRADAANLDKASKAIVDLITKCKREQRRGLIFLTGVPGSGKTLAGLHAVHATTGSAGRDTGDIVYLSGNTPLVTVLRESLTEDDYKRRKDSGEKVPKDKVRASVRARIQHIIDFLKEYMSDEQSRPPHERAIIFDEAQRAWNAAYGKQKFHRNASEPRLLLDIMGRHPDWCVIVGLIGGGQEINSGENGMAEWGGALRGLPERDRAEWTIFGPPEMADGDVASAYLGLGEVDGVDVHEIDDLTLKVPLRSYRSPRVAEWVGAVIDGRKDDARRIMDDIGEYPIVLTRDLETARQWLRDNGRGFRRYGLMATSTASRLRAEGLGVTLSATDGSDIAYWYLKPHDDVRSSFALEVVANEYTSQGLELDFVGVCWDGDLIVEDGGWKTRRFSGNRWQRAKGDRRRFTLNSYRVLLTRAREGLIIWVPRGDSSDHSRPPKVYDGIAEFLIGCGAESID